MVNFIFVGCDLHQETLVNRIAVGQGPSYRKVMANTRAGRASLIAFLKKESARHGGAPIVFGYEASGQGFVLHDQLQAAGIECYVLAPTKMEASIKGKRNKNDDRDAERVLRCLRAYKLAGEALPSVWVPDVRTRDDREIVLRVVGPAVFALAPLKQRLRAPAVLGRAVAHHRDPSEG